MRRLSLLTYCVFFLLSSISGGIREDVEKISELLDKKRIEEAKTLIFDLKNQGSRASNPYWLTKSSFFLGDIFRSEGDFAKSIIYYLEAIRYSEDADYDSQTEDLAIIYNRCGIIFKRFKAFPLAEEYYLRGAELAQIANDVSLELSISYNLAGLYREKEEYPEAIDILVKYLPSLEIDSRRYYNFNNRLALTYYDAGSYEDAIRIHSRLIAELPSDAYQTLGYYNHNLARSHQAAGELDLALNFYQKSIQIKKSYNSSSLFASFFGCGEVFHKLAKHDLSKQYFDNAEKLMDAQPLRPEYFELYKSQANLYYDLGDYRTSHLYEDLYAAKMNEYLEIQSEVREADQRYNMDLITKRYFAEVDKQERIASILFFSRLTSGSLFALLLLVIAYHRYQKIKLRKSIEKELIALKIIE